MTELTKCEDCDKPKPPLRLFKSKNGERWLCDSCLVLERERKSRWAF